MRGGASEGRRNTPDCGSSVALPLPISSSPILCHGRPLLSIRSTPSGGFSQIDGHGRDTTWTIVVNGYSAACKGYVGSHRGISGWVEMVTGGPGPVCHG